jgi:hypothetical protein
VWSSAVTAAIVVVALTGCARPDSGVAFRPAMPQPVIDEAPWAAEAAPAALRTRPSTAIGLPPGMGLPLVVTFEGEVPGQVVAAVREAAATWNTGLGEEVVAVGAAERGQAVHVAMGALDGVDPGLVYGAARRSVPGDVWRIDLSPETPARMLEGTIVHELGHMLGLGHNASDSSVMYQRATGVSRPSPEDLRQARQGVDALKAELAAMLDGWRANASR